VLKWLRDLCRQGESYEDFLSEVDKIPIGCDGLTALPHFCGTGSPDFRSDARGAFAGLTLGHTRTHLARAVMEACCFLLRELLELVSMHGAAHTEGDLRSTTRATGETFGRPSAGSGDPRTAREGDLRSAACGVRRPAHSRHGAASEVVRCLGGAAKSDLWLRMKADVLGIHVERPRRSDAASLGAALLAACGTGAFNSVKEASERWYRPGKVFEPDPARKEAYESAYERYLAVQERLY